MEVDNKPAEHPSPETGIMRLSDSELRKESRRRRLLTTAISSTCSILSMGAALWSQNNMAAPYTFLLIALIFGANISLVLFLFRWMAIPAKEAARRRKNSVLKMLSTSPQSEM